ncbi:unnamed protein product [Acanthosepion pharaonis]|uniref:Uncharacterized protein n=1 Tax=Acanthosepion pharaonis TaxID=158019 RepID=A0A812AKS3_ACAPH|nr:unnamed protein product [Sepia pharaonis]
MASLRICWRGVALLTRNVMKPQNLSFSPNTTTTLSAFCKSFQTFSTVHSNLLKPTSALKFQCTLPIRQFSCFTNSTIQGKFLEPCHKPQKTSIRTKIVCSKKKGKGKSNYAVLSHRSLKSTIRQTFNKSVVLFLFVLINHESKPKKCSICSPSTQQKL